MVLWPKIARAGWSRYFRGTAAAYPQERVGEFQRILPVFLSRAMPEVLAFTKSRSPMMTGAEEKPQVGMGALATVARLVVQRVSPVALSQQATRPCLLKV